MQDREMTFLLARPERRLLRAIMNPAMIWTYCFATLLVLTTVVFGAWSDRLGRRKDRAWLAHNRSRSRHMYRPFAG